MTRARMRSIIALAPHASETKARKLYEEVYGAQVGSTVTVERVRASIVEACEEMLARGDKAASEAFIYSLSNKERR